MKRLRSIYHFLGSLSLALVLIASVAAFVIIGTFLESLTQSHRYAAHFTYGNPLFAILLWGFFINIFFSTIRRWPFRLKHIPFLITHFGLLMILSGALTKHYFGIQGSMNLLEGSGSHEIFEDNTLAIEIQDYKKNQIRRFPIQKTLNGQIKPNIIEIEDGLVMRIVNYTPHGAENYDTWVKGDYVTFHGLQPIPIHSIDDKNGLSRKFSKKIQFPSSSTALDFFALRTVNPEAAFRNLFLEVASLKITDPLSEKVLFECALKDAINKTLTWKSPQQNLVNCEILADLNFSIINGFENPKIDVQYKEFREGHDSLYNIRLPLNGASALQNINKDSQHLGFVPLAIDLSCPLTLALIQDSHGNIYLFAVDPHGIVWSQSFQTEQLDTVFAHDYGFEGYSIRTVLPFTERYFDRKDREAAVLLCLEKQLQKALDQKTELSFPLELLHNGCENANLNFIKIFSKFLVTWNRSPHWLYPETDRLPSDLSLALSKIDWENVPSNELKGCELASEFFFQIEDLLNQNKDLIDILRELKWPLLSSIEAERTRIGPCSKKETNIFLTQITQQLFAAANFIPTAKSSIAKRASPETYARWLSIYLRACGIHLESIIPPISFEEMQNLLSEYAISKGIILNSEPSIVIETEVLPAHKHLIPLRKLEDNLPNIAIFAKKHNQMQTTSLIYDRQASRLKWPILKGAYLGRFQSLYRDIPYHLRLRHARQINYANSTQPYSFECDLTINDLRSGESWEKTISMNHVHETWDGYRFYLASVSPSSTAVKQIQIVINYDPAKYWLTYPGAFILSLGIILLFFMRPYSKIQKK